MSERNKHTSWREIIINAFDATYVADGVDITKADLPENKPDALTRVSTFLGLSNRILDKSKGQSFTNLWNNFIGYQDDVSETKKKINRYLRPFTIAANTINIPFKLLMNLVKLITEFLPQSALNAYENNILYQYPEKPFKHSAKDSPWYVKAGILAGKGLTILGWATLALVQKTGYAITSPINSVKKEIFSEHNTRKEKILGRLSVAFSIAVTVTVYAILFPLIIVPAIAPSISIAATHAPPLLGPFINAMVRPVAIVVSGIAGLLISTAGTGTSAMLDMFKNWWHTPDVAPTPSFKTQHSSNSHQLIQANLQKNKQETQIANQINSQPEKSDVASVVTKKTSDMTSSKTILLAPPAQIKTQENKSEDKWQSHLARTVAFS